MQRITLLVLICLSLFRPCVSQLIEDWTRYLDPPDGFSPTIWDICQTEDGGFGLAGELRGQGFDGPIWILRVDSQGEIIWQTVFNPLDGERGNHGTSTIISTDDDGFLVGGYYFNGRSPLKFMAIKLSRDGDREWERGFEEASWCMAAIETKQNNYLLGGFSGTRRSAYQAYALLVNRDGQPIWDLHYGTADVPDRIQAIREMADNGYYLSGEFAAQCGITKINDNGEIQWQRDYSVDSVLSSQLSGFVTMENGYCLGGGYAKRSIGENQIFWRFIRIDSDGNPQWDVSFRNEGYGGFGGIAKCDDESILIVGGIAERAEMMQIDFGGNLEWRQAVNRHTRYTGVVSDENGFSTICGWNQSQNGLIRRFYPVRSTPIIFEKSPDDSVIVALPGDTLIFRVSAIDYQEDSIRYVWQIAGDAISVNPVLIHSFQDIGDFEVTCKTFDEEPGDSSTWHVTVTDLYVSAFTPDTLALAIRRGESIDFSLDTVRAVEGDPVEYLWLKRNVDVLGEVDTAGSESGATIEFLQSGHYRIDGMAYRGESSDVVSWDVSVRGAIWAFAPEDLVFDVLPDSIVSFIVEPTVPDAEEQTIRWLIDGEVAAEDTMLFNWSFGEADSCPPHLVQVVVTDTVEADTVTWTVTVVEPDFVSDKRDAYPTRAELLTVSPNPFNSMLTIRYSNGTPPLTPPASGGGKVEMRFAIYDISGRLVADFSQATPPYSPPSTEGGGSAGSPSIAGRESAADRGGSAAERNVIWDATLVPAGVYFVRLQSGNVVATKKVVLMR